MDEGEASRYLKWIFWAAICVALSACAFVVPEAESDLAQDPTITAIRLPTLTPGREATLTATATPISVATPTFIPSPTATLIPTAVPTATAFRCPETVGRLVAGTFPSGTRNWSPPYLIYLPPCYEQSQKLYPTLYLFHGNIYTEQHWVNVGVVEAADAGIASGELPPFLIVLPFGGDIANNTSGGERSFEGVVVNDLIPFVEENYCAWPEATGRAIGGISRGGYWSLEIGFRNPQLFAAVGGHSAAIFADNAGPAFNPLSTGTDPRLIGLPIYMDIGQDDWLRQGAFDLHQLMTSAAVPHVWQVNPGAHSDAYWAEHVSEYLAWYSAIWVNGPANYPPTGGRPCLPQAE